MLDVAKAAAVLEDRLSARRFEHSLNVAWTAEKLAEQYGVNKSKAYYTGLVHDYAKGMSGAELLIKAEEAELIEDPVDRQLPDLLHAPVGAILLKQELGIKDEEILQAVSSHTLGNLNMSTLDKIIFLADMVEPKRDFPGIERLRCLVTRNLDMAMLYGLETTIKYCIDQQRLIHPRTVQVRNKFLEMLAK